MKLNKDDKEPDIFDKSEYDDLRASMSAFSPRRQNGRLQSAYDQLLASRGIVSLDRYGRFIIRDPNEYHRLEKIKAKMDAYDHYKLMELYRAFPEKKKEDDERMQKIREEFRAKMQTWKIKNSPGT